MLGLTTVETASEGARLILREPNVLLHCALVAAPEVLFELLNALTHWLRGRRRRQPPFSLRARLQSFALSNLRLSVHVCFNIMLYFALVSLVLRCAPQVLSPTTTTVPIDLQMVLRAPLEDGVESALTWLLCGSAVAAVVRNSEYMHD